jgi:hypothetical protein
MDPDYPLAETLTQKVKAANFQLKEQIAISFTKR